MAEIPVAPIAEAVSSAAVAATTVETGLTDAAQAGAAVTEGAVQAAGAVTETAGGAIVASAEATPGIINAGTESAVQEGLATGAETALETSGPDAALSEIVSGQQVITENQGADTTIADASVAGEPDTDQSYLTDSGMDQRAIDAANHRIAELKAQGKDPDFFERKTIYDEEASKLDTSSEIVSQEDASGESQTEKAEEASPAGEAASQAEQSQLTPEQQQIQQLEEKINNLTTENAELKANMIQINEALTEMKGVLDTIVKAMAEKEQDPKKKESLLTLLAKIAGIIVLSSVVQTGQEINPLKK